MEIIIVTSGTQYASEATTSVQVRLLNIYAGLLPELKIRRSRLVAKDLKRVLGKLHTAQGRIVIVDNFKNVYPYTSIEDADKKVQELLSQLISLKTPQLTQKFILHTL